MTRTGITRRRAIGAACALAAFGAMGGLALCGSRAEVTLPSDSDAEDPVADVWEDLLSPYPEAVGWLRVAGTRVDVPLMQATEDDPDFWLTHGPDGSRDGEGSVYLDSRCSLASAAAMAYGHHIGDTGRGLSDVHLAYEQSVLDGIGDMTLYARSTGEARALSPVFALSVDKSFGGIQRFGFADDAELRDWLGSLLSQASARVGGADDVVESASRAMTLVTCSSEQAGRRARTLLTFCERGGA